MIIIFANIPKPIIPIKYEKKKKNNNDNSGRIWFLISFVLGRDKSVECAGLNMSHFYN